MLYVCGGCALNRCQLINPALLHSPRALSTVSATLHNHPAQGREERSWLALGRATPALGTRPPNTPLQRRLERDVKRTDEELALPPAHSFHFYFGLSAERLLFNPSRRSCRRLAPARQPCSRNSNVRLVSSLHHGGPKFKSKLSVPPLKAANSAPFGFLRLHKP